MQYGNALTAQKVKFLAVEPDLMLHRDVAVVGSSSALLESDWGQEIDQHSEVIRFNGAPLVGFERQVGSRTTLQVVGVDLAFQYNPAYVRPSNDESENDKNRLENARRMIDLFPKCNFLTHDARDEEKARKHPRFATANYLRSVDPDASIYYMISKGPGSFYTYYEANRELEKLGISAKLSFGGPRSGLKIIMRCVLSGIRPTLFGFDVDSSITVARHYHDSIINAKVDGNRSHDIRGEMLLLSELQQRGLVEIKQ